MNDKPHDDFPFPIFLILLVIFILWDIYGAYLLFKTAWEGAP